MQNPRSISLVIAAAVAFVSLAGCANPVAGTGAPGAANRPATATANPDANSSVAAGLAEERDMEDYGMTADKAGYAVLAKGGNAGDRDAKRGGDNDGDDNENDDDNDDDDAATPAAAATATATAEAPRASDHKGKGQSGKRADIKSAFKAKLKAELTRKLAERLEKKALKAEARLLKNKGEHDAIAKAAKGAKWIDNGDGTKTKSMSSEVTKTINGQTMTRTISMTRTINSETGLLVSYHCEFAHTNPSGKSQTSTRDKVLQADGSYLVTYQSEFIFADGTKRVADWTKTIAADGGVTGTGTITWTGADGAVVKTVTVTLGGSDEAEEANAGGGTVTPGEESPAPTESPATEPTASPITEAIASPAAEASPEAEATPAAEASPAA